MKKSEKQNEKEYPNDDISENVFIGVLLFVSMTIIGVSMGTRIEGYTGSIIAWLVPITCSGITSILITLGRMKSDVMFHKAASLILMFYFFLGAIHIEFHRVGMTGTIYWMAALYIFFLALPYIMENLVRWIYKTLKGPKKNTAEANMSETETRTYLLRFLFVIGVIFLIGRNTPRWSMPNSIMIALEYSLVIVSMIYTLMVSYEISEIKQTARKKNEEFRFAKIDDPKILQMTKEGYFELTIEYINDKLTKSPEDETLILSKAICLNKLNRYEEAAEILNKIILVNIDDVNVFLKGRKQIKLLGITY